MGLLTELWMSNGQFYFLTFHEIVDKYRYLKQQFLLAGCRILRQSNVLVHLYYTQVLAQGLNKYLQRKYCLVCMLSIAF